MHFFENYSLKSLNTFGIDARAKLFSEAGNETDLLEALEHAQAGGLPVFVLGGGSNILLMGDIGGLVLKNSLSGIKVTEENADYVLVKAGAGVVWHEFVLHAVSMGWGGVENLSLIPGTVGASPIQNIGAYGAELKDVFDSLEAVHTGSGARRVFSREDCRFGYRDSAFKRELKGEWIITSVTLRLRKPAEVNTAYGDIRRVLDEMGVDRPGIADVSRAVIRIRRSKLPDPAEIGNAGSFFKNPEVPEAFFGELQERFPAIPGYRAGEKVKVPAGWLIETAGWKGYREGRVGVHERQALVLVNYGGAAGTDIAALAARVRESVGEKFGIDLTPEVNYIGG